jgi:iron complex outermembrane recepter protein
MIGAGHVKMTRLSNFKNTVAPLALGLALISAPSFAQDAEDGAEDSDKPIVVTGSLVKRPNEDSAAPVTVVGGDDFKGQGATKVEDLFNSLPQVIATQSSGVSNGADGTATVDLRGLGTNRTLVLVDGRRLMPGGIGGGAGADLNFIPSALISSVEILTGGASSTYGADAVSGVVNFKMNREFQGVRLDGQYSMYQHNNNNGIRSLVNTRFSAPEGSTINGGAYDVSLAIGSSLADDRGNIVAYAGLRHETAITQDMYDYSICTLNPDGANVGFACGGSGTPAVTRIGGISAANAALAGLPAAGSYTITGTGARPFVASDQFNFAPANYFRRPSTRYTAGVFADYEISSAFNPYMDVMFMDYSTEAQIAPSGAFFGPRTVNCNNPFLTTGNPTVGRAICGAALGTATTATALIGKRNVEGGNRFNDIGFNQFRIVTGMKGDISDNWSYDAHAQFGQISVANTYRNDVSSARIDDALLVGGTLANPVCLSGNPSCVPYNVFSVGGVTQAAADSIGIPLVLTGKTKETIVNATIFGDLGFASPFAEDTVGVAFGAEYRKEQLATQPDLSYINGDGAGQGGPTLPIAGQYTVRDVFAEAVIPLVQDKTFFQDLTLELGFRNSSYKVQGGAGTNSENTYKIAGNWSPVEMLKIRGSLNRAVRSPNIGELFLNQSIGLFAGTDPCAGDFDAGTAEPTPTATAAQCALTGVTAAQYGTILTNTAQQYNQNGGGNLGLSPEIADSWTVGFVLTPTRNISLSVDYYSIKIKNAVGGIGAQVILDQCLDTGDAFFCDKINRSTTPGAVGSLWLDENGFIDNRTTNTGSAGAKGLDVNFEAKFPIGENSLTTSLVGTYVDKLTFQPITGGTTYDCAGLYGLTCGNPTPEWKHAAKLRFATANDFAATLTWRYVGEVNADFTSPQAFLNNPGAGPTVDETLKAENYFDLLFSVPLKDTVGFRIGVNNILDNDPPLVSQASLGGFGNGNVFPGTYDHLGRYLFVGLTADF